MLVVLLPKLFWALAWLLLLLPPPPPPLLLLLLLLLKLQQLQRLVLRLPLRQGALRLPWVWVLRR